MTEPDVNKMAVEKLDGGIIQLRAGFSDLRADNMGQTEALEGMNVALYKLERVFSVVKKEFLEKGAET